MPNHPPADPPKPPNGIYNSTCGTDFSSWDGTFKYTDGTIDYTLKGQPTTLPSTTNLSNGNAIVFSLTYANQTVKFNGPTFKYNGPNNKAEYSGHCHREGLADDLDGWTATQQ